MRVIAFMLCPVVRLWGIWFCREANRYGPGPRHVPDWFREQLTGRTRPYVTPYADGRGRIIHRGIQVIHYDTRGHRISPPTKDELELELKEFEAPCLRCGGKVRYWRDAGKLKRYWGHSCQRKG